MAKILIAEDDENVRQFVARALAHAGHEITERHSRGDASTEDLRQAMMHYEALFERLVADVAPTGDAMSTASIHTADAPIEERHGHPVSPALSRRVEEVR